MTTQRRRPQQPQTPDAVAAPDPTHAERVAQTHVGPAARREREDARQHEMAARREAAGLPPVEATKRPIERDDSPMLDSDKLMAELDGLTASDFARMLDMGTPTLPESGEQITGTVVRVGRDTVFVDVGAKAEGVIDIGELDGHIPAVGDPLTAYVLHAGERGIRLARRLSGHAAMEAIDQAHQTGIPIDGKVTGRNPGGFTIKLGDASAFCPVSQIDRIIAADLDTYIGRTLEFRILEIRDRDIVVSHRVLAEEQAQAMAIQTWEELAIGQIRDGVVTGRKEFGVFVDIDGVRGLVPKRELGWDDAELPPNQGTVVSVRVLDVDREAGRVTLSLRDPALSPWTRIGEDILVGTVVDGEVVRIESFGAFVRIEGGLDGLVHVSNLTDGHVEHPSSVVKVGQQVKVRILSADPDRERLELGMKQSSDDWELENAAPQQPRRDSGSLGTMADLFGGIKLKK